MAFLSSTTVLVASLSYANDTYDDKGCLDTALSGITLVKSDTHYSS